MLQLSLLSHISVLAIPHRWYFQINLLRWNFVELLNINWLVPAVLVFVIVIFVYILVLLLGYSTVITSIRLVVMTVTEILLRNPILNFGSCTLNMGLRQPPWTSFSVFLFLTLVKEIAVIYKALFELRDWINRWRKVLLKLHFLLKWGERLI